MHTSLRLHGRGHARALALLAGALCALAAQAGPSDALHVNAGVGTVYDDNLFRLADGQPGYDNTRSDTARQSWIGLLFDRTYSLQRIVGHARLTRVAFSHFDQLDYDAKDAALSWLWQIGSHLSGTAGASFEQTLAPYTDVRTRERNLRVQRRAFADGAWRLHPSWQLRAAAARDTYRYDLLAERPNDRSETALEAGVDYLPATTSSVGILARRITGRYPNLRPIGATLFNDDFTQDEVKLKVDWHASASTTLQLTAGRASRHYAHGGERDASGFNGRATAAIDHGGKLSWAMSAWREFAPVESDIVSYSLNRGVSAGVGYALSSKIHVDAAVRTERRAFTSRIFAVGDLNDSQHQATLSARWTPRTGINVDASFARQRRSGLPFLGSGSFRANTASLNVSAQF